MHATINRPLSSFMDVRSSSGFVRGTALGQSVGKDDIRDSPTDYRLLDRMVRNDEILSTAFDTTVDVATKDGFDFLPVSDSESSYKESIGEAKKKFIELGWTEIEDNVLYSILQYGDAFVEKVKDDNGKLTELHPLETTEMKIRYDDHGTVLGYVQRPFNTSTKDNNPNLSSDTMGVFFEPDEVIHFTLKKIGSEVYSRTPLEPVAKVWSGKLGGHQYLVDAFMNLPPEVIIHLKGANKDQRKDTQQQLYRRKNHNGMIPITYGNETSGIEVERIGFEGGQNVLEALEYLREAVLMITRVPPVWIGLVNKDGANRGNSEAQIFSFETRVRKIQKKVEYKINKELMPELGFKNFKFVHNPINIKDDTAVLKNAAVLKSMNIKPSAIVKYLRRNGITEITDDDFETAMDMMNQFGDNGNQTARNELSPSRQGKDPRTDDMTNNLDRKGVSDEGAEKTAEKDAKQR